MTNFFTSTDSLDIPFYLYSDGGTLTGSIKILYSDAGTLVTIYEGIGFLDSPTNLTATVSGENQIDLSWTLNTGTEDCVIVENSKDGGTTWSTIESCLSEGTESYSHTSIIDNGEENHYRVKVSKNNGTESGYSNTDSAIMGIQGPTNLQVTSGVEQNDLSWTNPNQGSVESGTLIEILRHDGDGNFSVVDSLSYSSVTETYTDDDSGNGLTAGTTYTYKLRYNADKFSPESNTDTGTPTSSVAPETLVPDGDFTSLTEDNWLDSDGDDEGWDELDANDSNAISASVSQGNSDTLDHVVTLQNPSESHDDTQTWNLNVTWNSTHVDCGSGGSLDVFLRDSGGEITSDTFNHSSDFTEQTDTITLTNTEVNSISSMNDLRVTVETTISSPCCSNCSSQFPVFGSEGISINYIELDIS